MRRLVRSFVALIGLFSCTSVVAQIAPGVRHPDNLAEGVLMSQLMGCIGAASERPTEGLNMPFNPELTGIAEHKALPADLSSLAGEMSEQSRYLALDTPEGQVWLAFDKVARKCIVTAIAPSPEDVRTSLMQLYEGPQSPWQQGEPKAPDGDRFYFWDVKASPQLLMPAVHLETRISTSGEVNSQILIVTEASDPIHK